MHAGFICSIVESSQNPQQKPQLDNLLQTAEEQGWNALVGRIRRILSGERDISVLKGLDEEDQVIAESILRGLQDPSTLPDPNQKPDASMAAPGLAGMIHAAATGNVQALQVIADMAEQMSKAGGQMARLAAVIRPLVNGERDLDKLTKGMDSRNEQLVTGIVDELKKQGL